MLQLGEAVLPVTELDNVPLVVVVPVGLALAALSLVAYVVRRRTSRDQ